MSGALAGKVAIITGGGSGLGKSISERLAAEGASVAFTYVSSASKAQALQDSIIAKGGKALAASAWCNKPVISVR